ncbi:hypothetical protein NA57DRAFT_53158 [Rhizodiscina lignyota]|uniref:GH64 domain-containing protein n=1 Tax=Rhizodiscina lignyota TaxID=1504668 RepID=A0A9P4IG89_9PEZI|nr:hypothetical protein NA57DRAFT_53158 [Rhizodiscina lignyota]
MATLNTSLVNSSSTNTIYAYVTGLQIDNNNSWYLLQSDGKTVYNPASPSKPGAALARDCAIPLANIGSTKTISIPHTAGGRIYLSYNDKLTFYINPGPNLVEPSVTNPSDPNINIAWGFCEFTWNAQQLYANISYVDFVSIPIAIELDTDSGATLSVKGTRSNGLQTIANGLTQQSQSDGQGWSSLIVKNSSGNLLRALSPNQGMVDNANLFKDYYDPYVDQVWQKYKTTTMTIDTPGAGTVSGQVTNDGNLTLNNEKFSKPSTRDIFSANSGPFATGSDSLRNAIIPRLNAEFNRSTLLKTDSFPAPENLYYQETITNHYARIVHAANVDGRGYASPYDDVTPAGGVDQSGFVNAGDPKVFTVTVGGRQYDNTSTSTASKRQGGTVCNWCGWDERVREGEDDKLV